MLVEGSTSYISSKESNSIQIGRDIYDVFISFRGVDTRNTFVDHLHANLVRKGVFVFKDDIQLLKGESISPQLRRAIKYSRVSIIVFSKDYASSSWCLDEMTAIVKRHRELKQTVFPVFYDVDPSDVRKQNGVYQNAFVVHSKKFTHDPQKVDGWKRDMTHLAGLTGWDIRKKPESKEIEKVVQAVIKTLGHKFSEFFDDLIGIQPRVAEVESYVSTSGFRVLGIWGMDGMGKTTLAAVYYDKISHLYQSGASCFIENVSRIYKDGGAIAVQKEILQQTLKVKNLDAYSPSEISGIITNRLHKLRLLLVLDNVDQIEQLLEVHINPKRLCKGSRIIITTRNKHILKEHGVDRIYEVKPMNDSDARELLCRKAFKTDYSSVGFEYPILEVLKYARGLPLAIHVMGSFLYSRKARQWSSTLGKFEKNLPNKIMAVLNVSYDGLEHDEKEIFLNIACFFKGERKEYVSRILDACGLNTGINIPILAEKSLITIRNEEIHMHDMLQEFGKQIVRGHYSDRPRFWNRLWLYSDLLDAMITKPEAIEAEAIILNQKEDVCQFHQFNENLPKMENLKVLILYHSNFSGSHKFLSNSLRFLLWNGYPFTSLPSNFQPHRLVELNMPDSCIKQLWRGFLHLPYLKRMDMSNSKNLEATPCFEGMQNLERLDLTGCINLSVVHPSIGLLEKLVYLSLQKCCGLVNLDFGNSPRLWSLRVLRLGDCTKLENSPDFSGTLFLQYLDMDQCASLSTIHESVGALTKLKFLSLRNCTNLVGIPDTVYKMTSLKTLDLSGCSRFTKLPVGGISTSPLLSLINLDLSFCCILKIPSAIGNLSCLERLNLQGNKLTMIPSTSNRLQNLSYLNLSHCPNLQHFPELPTKSGASNSVGRYFKTTSESHNHRSGLYIFDSPKCTEFPDSLGDKPVYRLLTTWMIRLVKEPLHFRCGFDIVLPWHGETKDSYAVQKLFDHQFKGRSTVRINNSVMHVDWVGFVFFVSFELNNHQIQSISSHQSLSQPLPHPFYLSFESEYTEDHFDMPLNLELNKVDGKHYLCMSYISREHCHFVESGARITFKARQGLILKAWGLRVLTKKDIEDSEIGMCVHLPLLIEVEESSSNNNFETKIQRPYNWLVSNQDKAEKDEANGKETDLFNLALFTESSH